MANFIVLHRKSSGEAVALNVDKIVCYVTWGSTVTIYNSMDPEDMGIQVRESFAEVSDKISINNKVQS